ncbi:MAG: hypothetical protein WAM85_05125 [Terracidiphilus sp.]
MGRNSVEATNANLIRRAFADGRRCLRLAVRLVALARPFSLERGALPLALCDADDEVLWIGEDEVLREAEDEPLCEAEDELLCEAEDELLCEAEDELLCEAEDEALCEEACEWCGVVSLEDCPCTGTIVIKAARKQAIS